MLTQARLPRSVAKLGASTLASIFLLGILVPAVAFVASAGASPTLDNLQVTIQTSESLPFQYSLTAYNTSGYSVANFGGSYPEASFGLPDGVYLITASAYYQSNYYCNMCPMAKAANGSTAMPIRYMPPEYGYAVVKLTGPTQITITTKNSTQAPLTDFPVHVQFENGTAAVGASVSGYVVGSNYMYSQDWVTYGQTGASGDFTLVLPDARIQVSVSMSIPIELPKNISTIPIEVGGQKVNVTVYWQPNYVYLSGQALILPPESSAQITLKVQQSYPYPIYYSGGSTGSGPVTTVTETAATTAASAQPGASVGSTAGRIAPFSPSASQLSAPGQSASSPSASFGTTELLAISVGAAILVAGAALILSRKSHMKVARP